MRTEYRNTLTAVALVGTALATLPARAVELTDLPGVTASANGCYQGCGNAHYDAGNVIDGDYGASGNTGLNSWNYGTYAGGWVQVKFDAVYMLDRIELYGVYPYYNPFSLSVSVDGLSWTPVAVGGYQVEPSLTHPGVAGNRYGAVYDVANQSLATGVSAQYLRYSVGGGSPHWGYLVEMDVQGHLAPVPEPAAGSLALAGLMALGWLARRRVAALS